MLTDAEIEAIRKRDEKYSYDHVLTDRHILLDEVDRLRNLDRLAREWLKAWSNWFVCDHDVDHSYRRVQHTAREAYRKALEE